MANRNDNKGEQDYLDLLQKYGNEGEEQPAEQKKPQVTPPDDVVDEDFFEDESQAGDIDEYFEKPVPAKKVTPKNPAPPPIKNAEPQNAEDDSATEPVQDFEPYKGKNIIKLLAAKINTLPKKKKIILGIVSGFLSFVLILLTVAGVFIGQKFSLMGDKAGESSDDIIYEEEDIGDINIDIGSSDFKQALKDWATTGNDKHMRSKNVINVLLIGADSRKGKNEGNTDVMMLVSVNRKTKELKMVSFLRDSYLYIEGDSSSHCSKLNAAFSMGGPECLIRTIENNYKIDIDNYVMVNFESFKAIIDAVGGVSVDIEPDVANYIKGRFKLDMPVGDGVTLNGKQALAVCRARGCYANADVGRTEKQRQVIDSLVEKVIGSSVSEINKYIDTLLPYVDTGYSKSQIISLGIKALTGGWAKYDRKQFTVPNTSDPGAKEATSGSASGWIWVVDYQKAAHTLQMEIDGESNIILEENRTSLIDIYRGASYSGSSTTIKDNKDETEVPNTTQALTTLPETTMEQPTEVTTTDVDVVEPKPTEPTTQEETTQAEEPTTTPQEEPTQATPPVEENTDNQSEE